MIVGERLRELRKASGLSRRELAEKIEIGEANVQRYEDGKSDPGSEIVIKIARFFGVSTDYLLGMDGISTQNVADLNVKESSVIAAWRRGDPLTAIKVIIEDE